MENEEKPSDHSNDLPLMANISDIHVDHYAMCLRCSMEERMLSGWITLFCTPVKHLAEEHPCSEVPGHQSGKSTDVFINYSECESSDNCSNPHKEHSYSKISNTDDYSRLPSSSIVHEYCSKLAGSLEVYQENYFNPPTNVQAGSSGNYPSTDESLGICNSSSYLSSGNQHKKQTDFPLKENLSNLDTCLSSDIHGNCSNITPSSYTCNSSVSNNLNSDVDQTSKSEFKPYSSSGSQSSASLSTSTILTNEKSGSYSSSNDATQNPENIKNCLACPGTSEEFVLILDSDSIVVDSVKEVEIDEESNKNYFLDENPVCKSDIWQISRQDGPDLSFSVQENCVKIWKKGVCCSRMFPRVVKIHYHTLPDGLSLKWTPEQDGSLCVFTHGNWINNRSWFPSQDAPTAMATWQAEVKVTQGYTVIMSGDTNPSLTEAEEGLRIFKFYSDFKMPTSTLSIAVGKWTECISSKKEICSQNLECKTNKSKKTIPYRVFLPTTLHVFAPELHIYLPLCLQIVTDILGPHPFQRQDALIVPKCFDSLGMASPSLLFLSQSVLAGDFSMCVRVAHEICHTWFGIVIGPKDWTEEWLTEGFCTYLEDIVHAKVMMLLGHHPKSIDEYRELRDILKYRTLDTEISNTSQSLQLLRPNNEETDVRKFAENPVQYVKDGKNPDKRFMQLHYLKGYFLLRFLESIVGLDKFLEILKNYVMFYHGKLVSSEEAVSYIVNSCEKFREHHMTYENIAEDWLDHCGMPEVLKHPPWKRENELLYVVKQQVTACQALCKKYTKRRPPLKRKLNPCSEMSKDMIERLKKGPIVHVATFKHEGISMDCDSLVLFLEMLLDEEKISPYLLQALRSRYKFMECNADVQHRWCELVIKHKVDKHYADVKSFLVNHQAMGVYLYGELVLAGSTKLKQIAQASFQLIKSEMEPDSYKTVHAMLYGK